MVINYLQSPIKRNGYVGITIDIWTDYNSQSYLSLIFYFVKNSFLHHCVLAFDHYVWDTKGGKTFEKQLSSFLMKEGYAMC